METRPRLKVSSDRLLKTGIKPATPGLQGKWLIHYTTAGPKHLIEGTTFTNTISSFKEINITFIDGQKLG